MMSEETFDKILPDILKLTRSGHDITTKSTAVAFISDTIQETQDKISPKNSRAIARRMIECYSQNTVQTCLEMKQSLLQMYASCLGLQMKVLQGYPNTVKDIVKSLSELDEELELIKVQNLNEIIKGLPDSFITEEDGLLVTAFTPNIFINRFKDKSEKKLSKQIWEKLILDVPHIANLNSAEILERITKCMESNSYDDRVAGATALKELCETISEDQLQHPNFTAVLEAMMKLITGKYFNHKE